MIWPKPDPASALPFGRSELPEGNYWVGLEVAPTGGLGIGDVPIVAPTGGFGIGDVPIANATDVVPSDVPAATVFRRESPARTTRAAKTNDRKYFFTWFSSSQI